MVINSASDYAIIITYNYFHQKGGGLKPVEPPAGYRPVGHHVVAVRSRSGPPTTYYIMSMRF